MTPRITSLGVDHAAGTKIATDEHGGIWTIYHRHRDRLNRVWLWARDGAGRFIGFRKENVND